MKTFTKNLDCLKWFSIFSFLSTNILSPSMFQLNPIQRFLELSCFYVVFHSPSSARKFLVKYCHKSKQVLASSVMNTTFNFLSEKGLCPTTETDRKCKSVYFFFSGKNTFYLFERKIFSLTRSFHGHLGRLGTTSLWHLVL